MRRALIGQSDPRDRQAHRNRDRRASLGRAVHTVNEGGRGSLCGNWRPSTMPPAPIGSRSSPKFSVVRASIIRVIGGWWEQLNGTEYLNNSNYLRANSRRPQTGKFRVSSGIELGNQSAVWQGAFIGVS